MDAYIAGILDFSSVDYPQDSASVIFFEGCDLRCRYCYNQKLLEFKTRTDLEKMKETLREYKKFVNALVLTGGEPTLQPEALMELLKFAKGLGYKTKLDTNGNNPEVLKKALPFLDYVAIDLKTRFPDYRKIVQRKVDRKKIEKSLKLITGKSHEARTTIVLGLNDSTETMEEIGALLKKCGIKKYVLQQFHAGMGVLDKKLTEAEEPGREKLVELAKIVQKHGIEVYIRTRQAGEEKVLGETQQAEAGAGEPQTQPAKAFEPAKPATENIQPGGETRQQAPEKKAPLKVRHTAAKVPHKGKRA